LEQLPTRGLLHENALKFSLLPVFARRQVELSSFVPAKFHTQIIHNQLEVKIKIPWFTRSPDFTSQTYSQLPHLDQDRTQNVKRKFNDRNVIFSEIHNVNIRTSKFQHFKYFRYFFTAKKK